MNYSLLYSILLLLPFQLLCMNDQKYKEILSGFIKFGQDTGLRVEQPTPIISALQQPHAPAEQPLAAQREKITVPAHLISVFSLPGAEKKTPKETFACKYGCNKKLSRSGLRSHCQRKHADQAPFKCSVCRKPFFSKNGMAQHYILVHEEQFKNIADTES